jgi:hypothetical protein
MDQVVGEGTAVVGTIVAEARLHRTARYRLPRAERLFDPSRSARSSTVSCRLSSWLPHLGELSKRGASTDSPGPYSTRSYSPEKYDEKVVFQKMVILLVLRHLNIDPAVQRYIVRQAYFRGPWWRLMDRCHRTAAGLRRPSWVYLTGDLARKCATSTYSYCSRVHTSTVRVQAIGFPSPRYPTFQPELSVARIADRT